MHSPPILIGISSCLLGEEVRYDGGHKRDRRITDEFGQVFQFTPICPEVGIGMGTPRPPIRLVGDASRPHAVGVNGNALDFTQPLQAFGRKMATQTNELSGYIFKSKSPTCGMDQVKIYPSGTGQAPKKGVGLYAREIMRGNPLLPTEEETRLNSPILRDNFLERVFAYFRWQQLRASRLTAARLIEFHTRHKLVLMSHDIGGYRALGRLVADLGSLPISKLAAQYIEEFMHLLMHHRATCKRHTNVLQHIAGYLKKDLDKRDKLELHDAIEQYRLGHLPRIAPLTLLKHHLLHYPKEYLADQHYLYPVPEEQMLRIRCEQE